MINSDEIFSETTFLLRAEGPKKHNKIWLLKNSQVSSQGNPQLSKGLKTWR